LRAGSSVEVLVARAACLGMPALALTDFMTLAGVVRFQAACARHGIRGIVGTELAVADPIFGDVAAPAQFVVLAENRTGYAHLCQLLTDAKLDNPKAPIIPFASLAEQPEGLILLTGGHDGALARLILADRWQAATAAAQHYARALGPNRIFVELQHHALPESISLMQQLVEVAQAAGLRCVATNEVRYATREDYLLYDLLTCVRLGITVDRPHIERPRNDEAYLKDACEMAALFTPLPWGSTALAATVEIAARCDLSLLRTICTTPHVPLLNGQTPTTRLHALCEAGFVARFPAFAHPASCAPARSAQLSKPSFAKSATGSRHPPGRLPLSFSSPRP
jgi:DNA polymerase III alpha subunit